MGRHKPAHAQTTWGDVAIVVEEWEREYGIGIEVRIMWEPPLSAGAYVEVILRERGSRASTVELLRLRESFPARRMTGQAGAVLWAISCALRALETTPWAWSASMRRAATQDT